MFAISIKPTGDAGGEAVTGVAPEVQMPGKLPGFVGNVPKLDVVRAKAPPGVGVSPAVIVPRKATSAHETPLILNRMNTIAATVALTIHVLLVLALVYVSRTPGGMDQEAIEAIDVEIVAEPDMSAAPVPVQDPVIAIDLPPPLPAPTIEIERTPVAEIVPKPVIDESKPEAEPEKPTEPPPSEKPVALPRPEAPVASAQSAQPREGRAERQGGASTRGENPAAIDAFKRAVAVKIARSKPSSAVARAAQGTVILSFAIAASGAALDIRIAESSGSNTLDEAALATLRRASPFQSPPAGAPRSFVVPISFRAR